MDSLVGTTVGSYTLERAIGAGPTGQTYAARAADGGACAIKLVHAGLALNQRVEAYWAEQQRVHRLAHPHIAAPDSLDWTKSGRCYLVLELLEGLDLSETLSRHGRLPPAQVLLLLGQACLALEAAHAQGIVHGAIKPHNLFLLPRSGSTSRISTRLLDFGTTLLIPPGKQADAPPGAAGSPEPAYFAPEQFSGKLEPASDIFALGAVLFEALVGRRPFAGSYEELAEKHAEMPLEIPASMPRGLDEVVKRALAKAPAARYAGARALREALEAWASSKPPELDIPPLALFAKDIARSGVYQAGMIDQTVRVPIDELSLVLAEEHFELAEAEEELQILQKDKTHKPNTAPPPAKVPEDPVLAEIAQKASQPLRKEKGVDAPQRQPSPEGPGSVAAARAAADQPKLSEGYFDEDGELVELPLERSVKAYLADLQPLVAPPGGLKPRGNGESLDGALDQFMREAKAWNASLPPPVIEDKQLAALARVPAEEPAIATEQQLHLAGAQTAPRRSIVFPVVVAFFLGGLLFFAGYKLLGPESPAPTQSATEEPGGATVAAPSRDPASAAEQQGGVEEPAAKTPEPTTTEEATGTAGTAATEPSPAAADAVEPGATAASTADAAPVAAPSAPVTEPETAATAAAPATDEQPAAKPQAKRARPVRPATKRPRAPARAAQPRQEKQPEKPKKPSSDWVDPFSQ